ncbi:ATP-dependent dethiobiotin synthetase BioD [Capnocytophaga stomatis]|uniref:ATP-dependent dethiobiotin synthetase BioD n=1 Tax=Capnocytophaga stomatis TaxID=1848904 RepID=A0A250FVG8_9FLAO|nr:dethiobiotin synthase [Capnocytophaga stomatis]ATA89083.1 dethiobiotin synthase [Capnocytophaga stomatis]GIJ97679.1 ATP-dependent dethiobiotin synthetase BioD [Capnocytophaga stomatis]
MKNTYFITGISTDVGKTIVSAIITEALQADYWKPIQAGDLENSDTHKVKRLISNNKTLFHSSSYALNTPASPHLSAELDGISIDIKKIKRPDTDNHLVIEGAGGLLVPLNQTDTIADLILPSDKIIIVSRHYLGSINHTLLTYEALKHRNLPVCGIIFSGKENKSSESIILKKTGAKFLGRIDEEPYFDKNVISYYADKLKLTLEE